MITVLITKKKKGKKHFMGKKLGIYFSKFKKIFGPEKTNIKI